MFKFLLGIFALFTLVAVAIPQATSGGCDITRLTVTATVPTTVYVTIDHTIGTANSTSINASTAEGRVPPRRALRGDTADLIGSTTSTLIGGPYSYVVTNGATSWLNSSPPTTIKSFVTLTSVVVVSPTAAYHPPTVTEVVTEVVLVTRTLMVTETASATWDAISSSATVQAISTGSAEEITTVTSHVTVFGTRTVTISGPWASPTKVFTGFGISGWNSTTVYTTTGTAGVSSVSAAENATTIIRTVQETLTFALPTGYNSTVVLTIPVTSAKWTNSSAPLSATQTLTVPSSGFPYGPKGTSVSAVQVTITPSSAPTGLNTSSTLAALSTSRAATTYTSGYAPIATSSANGSVSLDASSTFAALSTSLAGTGYTSTFTPAATSSLNGSASLAASTTRNGYAPPPAPTSGFQTVWANTTSTPSTTTQLPTGTGGCGEVGDFVVTWDDLPDFNPSPTNSNLHPPVLNPYHHLFYAYGYRHSNGRYEPFEPKSAPEVAIYSPDLATDSPATGALKVGEIGAGPRSSDSAFLFNAYRASFGCGTKATQCLLRVSAWHYEASAKQEVLAGQQYFTLPACAEDHGCQLTTVEFPTTFRGLSGVQIEAFIANNKSSFIMDSLEMGWKDNSCEAGLKRASSRM